MKLVHIGYASLPILSSVRCVYLDKDKEQYYTAHKFPPSKYESVRDETNDFMLLEQPEQWIRVVNKKYNQEVNELIKLLEPVRHIDITNKKIILNTGSEFDFNPLTK